MPNENKNMKITGNIIKIIEIDKFTPVKNITSIRAINVANRFTNVDKILDNGNKYLGMYILRISVLLLTTECIALFVDSVKKLKIVNPEIRYTGKFCIFERNNVEKTNDKIDIVNKGFNRVHNNPNTERRYLVFISRCTNSFSNG